MRIIITGGTGLIGRELTRLLLNAGREIVILSRNPARHELPEGVQGVAWDGRAGQNWQHLADGARAIVNLAGEPIAGNGFPPPRWTAARKQRILQSRLDAGQAVVEAITAASRKPAVLIQASGIDYYGNVPGDAEVTEDWPKGSGFLADVTEQWEASTAVVEEMGVRRAVIRTGIVLSMAGGALPQTVRPFRFFLGGPLGDGRQYWPWIHRRDEARAIQFLIENEAANGVFNLCAPNPVTNKAFAREIGRVLGRPSALPAPAFALKLLLGEMAALLLDGRRALPRRLTELGFTFQFPRLRDALVDVLLP